MNKFLTRDQILAAPDIRTEECPVPEWGGIVLVKGLTGTGRDAFEASVMKGKGKDRDVNMANFRAKLVALSVVGEEGTPLFSQSDVEALGKKSAAALQRIFNAAQKLSGLSDEDVEELAGKSETAQSEDSTSS